MQTQSKVLDDLAKLVTNAAGAAQGVRQEVEMIVRQQLERFLADCDLVTREEFEAARAMAVKAREHNDALEAKIKALEEKLEKLSK